MKELRMRATGLEKVIVAQGRKKRWLANEVRLSESYLGRVIGGTRTISKSDAERVASALGIPLFLLFEFTDVPERDTQEAMSA